MTDSHAWDTPPPGPWSPEEARMVAAALLGWAVRKEGDK